MLTGKVSSLATDIEGTKVTEQLGYTHADVFNDATANTTLRNFVQGITGLTTNTYVSATVTYEVDLDTNNPPAAKSTPTLSYSPNKITFSKGAAGGPSGTATDDGKVESDGTWNITQTFSYNGDGSLYASSTANNNYSCEIYLSGTNTYTAKYSLTSSASLPATLKIGATEGTNYKAVEPITVTFNS